ncbi:MAG TPA: CotH kinase family protein [Pedobacter sp.]|nr:CotH kinase family protein [Pedobacter sp.]
MNIPFNMIQQRPVLRKLACLLMLVTVISACKKSEKLPDEEPGPVLKSDKTITAFSLMAAKNPGIAENVKGEIIGDTIFLRVFAETDISKLIPFYSYVGKQVVVNDKPQESNVTFNNFSTPVPYTVVAEDGSKKTYFIKLTESGIAALYINTNGAPIVSKDDYIDGTVKIIQNFKTVAYEGVTEVKGRGNSTWFDMPKKPYRLKLDKKASLLGMPSSKNWVLLANYADKTLIRNELAFTLSREMGREFTPASKYVELYLNGEYRGNYQLTEQIKEGKGLVDVEDGGFLIEQDLFAGGEEGNFFTSRDQPFVIKYPDVEDITNEQRDYIRGHFQKFEDALFADNFADPVNGYRKYFDIDTYIDHYLINEIIGNPDAFRSTYMFKKKDDDKIYTGPIWDFDKAANNDNRLGDQVRGLMANSAFEPKMWLHRMLEDRTFRLAVRQRWNFWKLKTNKLTDAIAPLEKKLSASQVKNFIKWDILKKQSYLEMNVSGSWAGDVEYLRRFLTTHIAWLDTKFNSAEYQ